MTIEAQFENGVLRPLSNLALRPGERVGLVVLRHPDPLRWDMARFASGAGADMELTEEGLDDWADRLDA